MDGDVLCLGVIMNATLITSRQLKNWSMGLLPIILLIGLLGIFLRFGLLGILEGNFPPIEKLAIQRVHFTPEHINISIMNDGPEPVTVAQLTVNEVLWQFSMTPENTLEPLQRGTVSIDYPWVEGEPLSFTLFASDGVTFEKEIAVATLTPIFDANIMTTFLLLGLYVGVIPVLLGLLWFPLLRKLGEKGYVFLLMLTVGILVFLAFDTLAESLELLEDVPETMNGEGILAIGLLLSLLILGAVGHRAEQFANAGHEGLRSLLWGYSIAIGIGLHNLGEGLAIGSSYAIGEIALGTSLVIGFMLHNVTEGVAIVSPLTRHAPSGKSLLAHLVSLGLIAGAPTIAGTFIGGFAYSPSLALLFLSIGTGAIMSVVFEVLHTQARGNWKSLFSESNAVGFLAGLLVMYGTGFLVVL